MRLATMCDKQTRMWGMGSHAHRAPCAPHDNSHLTPARLPELVEASDAADESSELPELVEASDAGEEQLHKPGAGQTQRAEGWSGARVGADARATALLRVAGEGCG